MTSFTVAILAGGQSRRMGRDKAQITVDGLPLLERTARTALAACPSVVVVGRALPEDWPLPGVAFLEDEAPDQGPLGGLATALRDLGAAEERGDPTGRPDAVLLLACDLPALTEEALPWLMQTAQERQPLGAGLITVNNGRREPLFSVYTPHCLPRIETNLAAGRRSLQALIDAGDFKFAGITPTLAPSLLNVNTPEELARWNQTGVRRP